MINFKKAMKKLRSVDGYLGSAVINYTGEILYIDQKRTGIDVEYSASLFNNALRKISKLSLDIGLSDVSLVETRTFDGHIFLIYNTGDQYGDSFSKLNVFAIFRDDGNVGLAKMIIDKTSQRMSKKIAKL